MAGSLRSRLFWFVALWLASLAVISTIALVIRVILPG